MHKHNIGLVLLLLLSFFAEVGKFSLVLQFCSKVLGSEMRFSSA